MPLFAATFGTPKKQKIGKLIIERAFQGDVRNIVLEHIFKGTHPIQDLNHNTRKTVSISLNTESTYQVPP